MIELLFWTRLILATVACFAACAGSLATLFWLCFGKFTINPEEPPCTDDLQP